MRGDIKQQGGDIKKLQAGLSKLETNMGVTTTKVGGPLGGTRAQELHGNAFVRPEKVLGLTSTSNFARAASDTGDSLKYVRAAAV